MQYNHFIYNKKQLGGMAGLQLQIIIIFFFKNP